MNEINGRINLVVSKSGLTKTAFAKRLNITQAYVSILCKGEKTPSDRTIGDICREFNVSEKWLRTGEGEMFSQKKQQPLDELLSDLLGGEAITDEDRILVKNFLELPDDSRKAVIEFVQKCAVELSTPVQLDTTRQERTVADTGGQERTELDMEARMAELERQNQVLTARLAAVEEEDAKRELMDGSSTSPSESAGKFSSAEKVKI